MVADDRYDGDSCIRRGRGWITSLNIQLGPNSSQAHDASIKVLGA
jgi:hypothetical protein